MDSGRLDKAGGHCDGWFRMMHRIGRESLFRHHQDRLECSEGKLKDACESISMAVEKPYLIRH